MELIIDDLIVDTEKEVIPVWVLMGDDRLLYSGKSLDDVYEFISKTGLASNCERPILLWCARWTGSMCDGKPVYEWVCEF